LVRRAPGTEPDVRYLLLYAGMSAWWLVIAIPMSAYFLAQSWGFLPLVLIAFVMFFRPNRPIALVADGDERLLRVPRLWGAGQEWRCSDIAILLYEWSPLRQRGTARLKLVLNDQTAHVLPGSTGRLLRAREQLRVRDDREQSPRVEVVDTPTFLQRLQDFTGAPLESSGALRWP
jgi:hypothetical protein